MKAFIISFGVFVISLAFFAPSLSFGADAVDAVKGASRTGCTGEYILTANGHLFHLRAMEITGTSRIIGEMETHPNSDAGYERHFISGSCKREGGQVVMEWKRENYIGFRNTRPDGNYAMSRDLESNHWVGQFYWDNKPFNLSAELKYVLAAADPQGEIESSPATFSEVSKKIEDIQKQVNELERVTQSIAPEGAKLQKSTEMNSAHFSFAGATN